MAPADDLLKKLRRLPANMVCANCGSDAQKGIGFGSICVAFKTFVCDYCKTSHQAISHRVKSVSMSEWTMDEVRELTAERGGGNDAARNIWLANAPAIGKKYNGGTRPKKGDRIDFFKQFTLDCYELGKFKGDAAGANSLVIGGSNDRSNDKTKMNGSSKATTKMSVSNFDGNNANPLKGGPWGPSVAASQQPDVKAAAPSIDLLGFEDSVPIESSDGGFDFIDSGFLSAPNTTTDTFCAFSGTTTTSLAQSTCSDDLFGSNSDDFSFDAFGSNIHANNETKSKNDDQSTFHSNSGISMPVTGLNKPEVLITGVLFGHGTTAVGGVSSLASPRSMSLNASTATITNLCSADPFSSLGNGSTQSSVNASVGVSGTASYGVSQPTDMNSQMGGQLEMSGQWRKQPQMGGMLPHMGGMLPLMGGMQPQKQMCMNDNGHLQPNSGLTASAGMQNGGMSAGMTTPQGSMSLSGSNTRVGTSFGMPNQSIMTSNSRNTVSTAFAFDPMQLSSLGETNSSDAPTAGQPAKKAEHQDIFASLSLC